MFNLKSYQILYMYFGRHYSDISNTLFPMHCFVRLGANVRVYDHLRCQSDSVSRYTKVCQRDNICNLMPSN